MADGADEMKTFFFLLIIYFNAQQTLISPFLISSQSTQRKLSADDELPPK